MKHGFLNASRSGLLTSAMKRAQDWAMPSASFFVSMRSMNNGTGGGRHCRRPRLAAEVQDSIAATQQGFSLVELSIVLVILGLLTGGILTGQSLIRAAELRSVTTEFSNYQTAVMTFRDKYFALPGDMRNAYTFWGTDCGTNSDVNTTAGGCNGNGDGILGFALAGGAESALFWKHLSQAGLIEGSYDGSYLRNDIVGGVDVPKSKLSNGMYTVGYTDATTGGAAYWNGSRRLRNYYVLGTYYPNEWNANSIVKPEEAWNIDTKIDDANPGTGVFAAMPVYNGAMFLSGCVTGTTAGNDYDLSDDSASCSLSYSMDKPFKPTM